MTLQFSSQNWFAIQVCSLINNQILESWFGTVLVLWLLMAWCLCTRPSAAKILTNILLHIHNPQSSSCLKFKSNFANKFHWNNLHQIHDIFLVTRQLSYLFTWYISGQWRHMASYILINIGSGNVILPVLALSNYLNQCWLFINLTLRLNFS